MKKINTKRIILFIFLFGLFISLSILVNNNKTLIIDNYFIKFILSIRNNFLTIIFKYLTNLCSTVFLLILSFLNYFIIKNKKICHLILLNLILASVSNALIKLIFCRPRPEIMLIKGTGYSYPSGHSMVSFSFYVFIMYLVLKTMKNIKLRRILIVILPVIVLLIGFSRMYLGVHYITDVIGGFLLASIYLIGYITFIEKKGMLKE